MCSFFFPSVALELVPLNTAPTLIIMVSRKDQVITWILLKHSTKTLRQAAVLHGRKLYAAWFIYVFNAPVKTRHSLAPVWSFILGLSLLTAPPRCSCYSLCSVNCPLCQQNQELGIKAPSALLDWSCQKPPRFNSTEISEVTQSITWGPCWAFALLTAL